MKSRKGKKSCNTLIKWTTTSYIMYNTYRIDSLCFYSLFNHRLFCSFVGSFSFAFFDPSMSLLFSHPLFIYFALYLYLSLSSYLISTVTLIQLICMLSGVCYECQYDIRVCACMNDRICVCVCMCKRRACMLNAILWYCVYQARCALVFNAHIHSYTRTYIYILYICIVEYYVAFYSVGE